MAFVVIIPNPFEPLNSVERYSVPGNVHTVREWLRFHYRGFTEFERPTICLFNGQPILRKDWGAKIGSDDVVTFVTLVGTWALVPLIISLVLTAVSVVLALVVKAPTGISEKGPDPVYELDGQRNQVRLGYPIEVPYGRPRLFPSYAARPFAAFENNDQFQFQLFCLGQGAYETGQVLVEDTPIENFSEIEYAIYQPGEAVTLFPDNVVTSSEVTGTELFGPNETKYTAPGNGFVANGIGTLTELLQIDLSFPQGLYYTNTDGSFGTHTINVTIEYREIDAAGVPVGIGSWQTFELFTRTLSTQTPQRFTLQKAVPAGRYAVRAYRTNNKDFDARAVNVARWDALRAVLPSTRNYGDVTLLAVKARATNNLSGAAASKINLYATRKLPVWDGTAWTLKATRSIVWAFVDIFRSQYGGRLTDEYFDLDALLELDAVYSARGEWFDYVFDQQTTAWDAARLVARVGRAVPMLSGSLVTMIRDAPQVAAMAVFTPANIVEGSFRWNVKLAGFQANDGVEVTYVDAETWKPETLLCLIGDDVGDDPEKIELRGCTGRNHAYQLGLYLRGTRKYQKENVQITTGLEGHIPTYGDLAKVSHDLPRWGTSGLILDISLNRVTLSEPVIFEVGTAYVLLIRLRDGTASGPWNVTPGDHAREVLLASPLDHPPAMSDRMELPLFAFGAVGLESKRLTVVHLAPGEGETVDVGFVNYAPEIYEFDSITAPPLGDPGGPVVVPLAPSVTGLAVVPIYGDAAHVRAVWNWTLGARYYLVETSVTGAAWNALGTVQTTSLDIPFAGGELYVRVAAVGAAQGPWLVWHGDPSTLASGAFSFGFSNGFG
jgi:hypothetical protein